MPKVYRLAPLFDIHGGLKLAAMPSKFVESPDSIYEAVHRPNKIQKWINGRFKKAHDLVFDGEYDEVITVLGGDEVHGVRVPHETWTGSLTAQADAYIQMVLPWVNKSAKTYSIVGTRYHMGDDGSIEDKIARELGVYKHQAFHKMEIVLGDFRVSVAHKGPKPGSRFWTRKNSMRLMLNDIAMRCLAEGREPSDLYLWGHFHEDLEDIIIAEGPWGRKEVHGQVMPAWCTPGEYALANVNNLELADVGIVYYTITGKHLERHSYVKKWDAVERVAHE